MVKEILIYPKDKDILTQVSEEVKDVSEVQELIQERDMMEIGSKQNLIVRDVKFFTAMKNKSK